MTDAPPDQTDDLVLDAVGLKCPLPVLLARKALKRLKPGGLLTVRATDPGAPDDFRHFCTTTNSEFLSSVLDGDVIVIALCKSAAV